MDGDPNGCFVDLYWLPVAAGTGSWLRMRSLDLWEAFEATRARRPRAGLCHSALKIGLPGGDTRTIELTPVFRGETPPREMTGPVGVRGADRLRLFRYQVRCAHADRLPDEEWAIVPPVRIAGDCATAEAVLALTVSVPKHTWGRRVRGTPEMWTSDSAISWLLARANVGLSAAAPPPGWRAPGWRSGLELVGREALPTAVRIA